MMYIVLLTTIGAASCPRFTAVENVQATLRFVTFPVLIWSSPLNRVLEKFLAGMSHCPSSGSILGGAPAWRFKSAKMSSTTPDPLHDLYPIFQPFPRLLFSRHHLRNYWFSSNHHVNRTISIRSPWGESLSCELLWETF